MPTITIKKYDTATVPAASVEKAANFLDATWTAQPELFLQSWEWRAAPGTSEATLGYTYGWGRPPGIAPATLDRHLAWDDQVICRHWVRIEIPQANVHQIDDVDEASPPSIVWYGSIEAVRDQLMGIQAIDPGGGVENMDCGRQTIVCYGVEFQLDREPIRRSWFKPFGDPANDPAVEAPRPITFNEGGLGNRIAVKPAGDNSYAFGGDGDYWSTRDIVEYLLDRVVPRDTSDPDLAPIPWEIGTIAALPDFDRPVVSTKGRTIRQIFNQLINRERLLGWTVRVEERMGVDPRVAIVDCFTYTRDPIVVPITGSPTITANPRVWTIHADHDDITDDLQVSFTGQSLDAVDQVRARGARRRAAFGARADTFADPNHIPQLEPGGGWDGANQISYSQGDSLAGDYPAATELRDRRERDMKARRQRELADVYSFLSIPLGWDAMASDSGSDKVPVDPVDDANIGVGDPGHPIYWKDLRILPTLPFLAGVIYSNAGGGGIDATPVAVEKEGEEIPPLLFLEAWTYVADPAADPSDDARLLPQADPGVYVYSRGIGDSGLLAAARVASGSSTGTDDARPWSVEPRAEGRGLRLNFSNIERHAIGMNHFTALDHDLPQVFTDFEKAVATIAVETDRYCEVLEPDDATLGGLPNENIRRVLEVNAGDGYRLDFVAAGTPIDVDPKGALVTLAGGIIRDDRERLQAIAKMAYTWRARVRRGIQLSLGRTIGALRIGDYLQTFGQEVPLAVESVVTEMSYQSPGGAGEYPRPTFRVTTAYGELDPLTAIGAF